MSKILTSLVLQQQDKNFLFSKKYEPTEKYNAKKLLEN
jgi:hypothetical protein